ncbi:MAG: hypothetical protein ACM3U2_06465 [Deltaproteobacteria bacterium]
MFSENSGSHAALPADTQSGGHVRECALQRNVAVDPVEMINLIRRDFESSRWLAVLLAVVLALGTALWLPALSARGSIPRTARHQPAISVLSDPFDGQKK